MNGQYEDCMRKNEEIQSEISSLSQDLENRRLCGLEMKALQECEGKLDVLQGELDGVSCAEFISKAKALEHDLGECNVEWGACQQMGRQWEMLDKKRLDEIDRQKNRFDLCNQQLMRLKEKNKK